MRKDRKPNRSITAAAKAPISENSLAILALAVSAIALLFSAYQAYLQRDLGQRELRAYIALQDPNFNKSERGLMTLPILNAGATPANEVRARINTYFVPAARNFEADFDFRDFSNVEQRISRATVYPGQTKEFLLPLDVRLLNQVNARMINLLVYGWVEYDDVFGSHHRSNFAYHVQPLANNDPNGVAFIVYDKFNTAD